MRCTRSVGWSFGQKGTVFLAAQHEKRNTCTVRWMVSLGFSVAACAPSYNVVYEGDARFEHCYALDDSPRATMEQKSACWRDWTEHHTLGQTRDRIEYA